MTSPVPFDDKPIVFDEHLSRRAGEVVAQIGLVQHSGYSRYTAYEKTTMLVLDLLRPLYERLEFLKRCGLTVEVEEVDGKERYFLKILMSVREV